VGDRFLGQIYLHGQVILEQEWVVLG